MIFNLAKIYFVVFILYTLFSKKVKLSKKQFICFWGLFVLSISIITYNMNPGNNWDTLFHYGSMNEIRFSGISFSDFLFHNTYSVGGYGYGTLYAFNILRYFVICISKNNLLLPAICVFIDYSIIGYIAIDWSICKDGDLKINLLSLLLCFTFIPYVHAACGMRNALCANIMGLAVYLYLYKKKHIIVLIILSLIAVTIHPAALITIPFVFLAKLNIGLWGYISVFMITVSIQYIVSFFINSNISFLVFIGNKYLRYTSDGQFRGTRAPLYAVLIITLIFLFVYFILYRHYDKTDKSSSLKTMYNFFAMYMIYIFNNIGNYDMVLRPAYVLGPLSPIIISFFEDVQSLPQTKITSQIKSLLKLLIYFAYSVMCIYVQYNFYENYGNNFFNKIS